MSKVGGGGGGPPKPLGDTPTAHQKVDLKTKEGVQKFAQTAEGVPKKVVDSFQRAGPALESKLSNMAGKVPAKGVPALGVRPSKEKPPFTGPRYPVDPVDAGEEQ